MTYNEIPDLRDLHGNRLYLNRPEQERFWHTIVGLPPRKRLFLETLILAGPRISEALELHTNRIEMEPGNLVFRTLKRGGRLTVSYYEIPGHLHNVSLAKVARQMGVEAKPRDLRLALRVPKKTAEKTVWRVVPVPRDYLARLSQITDTSALLDPLSVFTVSRRQASNWVSAAMRDSGITGPQACAKGLRHTFGVNHALAGTQQAILQRLMGHANPAMTARYMQVVDDDLREIMQKTWPPVKSI